MFHKQYKPDWTTDIVWKRVVGVPVVRSSKDTQMAAFEPPALNLD